ncbi:MAG: histidinol-phosphatase [Erysipelotrichaceae bacterium]|nr:histidinol-phosphatase [Erysipelotrichaceae bacterium]
MLDYNYHTHTYRCGHAFGTDEEYVEAAIRAGFKVLGFSDHGPSKVYKKPGIWMDWSALDDYIESINTLKEKYKDRIKILVGLETEYFEELHDEKTELHDRLDYLILGQHYTDPSPEGNSYFHENSDEDILLYADNVCKAIDSGLYTYLCHPDVFMYKQKEFTESCARAAHIIARKCAMTGTPMEINIHGGSLGRHEFPAGIQYYYPHKDFWRIAAQYPVKLVIGVDAHRPEALLERDLIDTVPKEIEDLGMEMIKEPFIR